MFVSNQPNLKYHTTQCESTGVLPIARRRRAPTLPVGLARRRAWHRRSSEHVGENKMSLLINGMLFEVMISKSAQSSALNKLMHYQNVNKSKIVGLLLPTSGSTIIIGRHRSGTVLIERTPNPLGGLLFDMFRCQEAGRSGQTALEKYHPPWVIFSWWFLIPQPLQTKNAKKVTPGGVRILSNKFFGYEVMKLGFQHRKKRTLAGTACPTSSDIFQSSKHSSRLKLVGLSSLKRGKRDIRASALSFTSSSEK